MKIIGIILAVIVGIIALSVLCLLLWNLRNSLPAYFRERRRVREIRSNARRVRESLSSARERTERLSGILNSMERSEREEYLADMAKNANSQNPDFYESSSWLWRIMDSSFALAKEAMSLGRRYPIQIIGHLDARNLGPVLEVPSHIDIAGISIPVTRIGNYGLSWEYQYAGIEDPCSGTKLSNLPEVEKLILPESLIGYLVLEGFPKLRGLRLPELLKGCSVHDCRRLERLEICNKDFDFESLYLTRCPELREVTIPSFESLHEVAHILGWLPENEVEDEYDELWNFYNMLVYGKNVESGIPSVVRFADGCDGSRLILPTDRKEAMCLMQLNMDIYGCANLKRLVFPKDFPFGDDVDFHWHDFLHQVEWFCGLEILELPECVENFGQYDVEGLDGNIVTHSYFMGKEDIDVEGTVVNAWEFLRGLESLREIWVSAECDVTELPLPDGCVVKRYLTQK